MDLGKIPNRTDLRSFILTGNIDHTFDVETQDGTQKVSMLLLTDSEDTACHNHADRRCFTPNSLMTREKYYRAEVLARSIYKINDTDFGIKEDERVEMLREFIGALQGPMVVRLWECYNKLRELQMLNIGKIEEGKLKNSSGSQEN